MVRWGGVSEPGGKREEGGRPVMLLVTLPAFPIPPSPSVAPPTAQSENQWRHFTSQFSSNTLIFLPSTTTIRLSVVHVHHLSESRMSQERYWGIFYIFGCVVRPYKERYILSWYMVPLQFKEKCQYSTLRCCRWIESEQGVACTMFVALTVVRNCFNSCVSRHVRVL